MFELIYFNFFTYNHVFILIKYAFILNIYTFLTVFIIFDTI